MEGKSIYDTEGMINLYREGFKKCLKEISEKKRCTYEIRC